jgi:hypothetical protein
VTLIHQILKKIKALKSPDFFFTTVNRGSQNIKGCLIFFFLFSHLVYSQIWLNILLWMIASLATLQNWEKKKKKSDKSDQKNCIFGGGCHKIMFVGYNFKISLK